MIAASLLLAATFTRPLERVSTMDPAFAQTLYDSRAIQLVCQTPLEIDYLARPYRLIPGLCELPEVSSNGLVYVFRVRTTGAGTSPSPREEVSTNGTCGSLTAADIVRSLERLRDPKLVTPNAWLLKSVDRLEAPDARTFVARLKTRCHFFPWLMAMSSAAVRRADGSGTGPYELVSWHKNHEMVFRRRGMKDGDAGERWKGFDTIRYLVIDDASTQWLMFLKGELDFLGEISKDNWDAVIGPGGKLDPRLAAQGVTLHAIPTLDSMYIGINMRDPVLGPNRALRRALNAAFDHPAYEEFYSGRIIRADGPVPPGVDGRLETPYADAFDLGKARKLMAEAGYPGGIDPKTGRRLVLTLSIGRASQDSREAGELLASFYAKIGIKLELAFHTWDAFLKAVNEGRAQLFRMGWVGDYPDAENFLQLFHSKNVSPGPNHGFYVSAAFDAEYDAAMASPDAETRNAHWRRCQEIVRADAPWVFTHYTKSHSLVRRRVGNYVPSVFPYGQEKYLRVREDADAREEK